jgi:hypothetical protein
MTASDEENSKRLREQAAMARRWTKFVTDKRTSERLSQIAAELEEHAERLDAAAQAIRVNAEIAQQLRAEAEVEMQETKATVARSRDERKLRARRRQKKPE